MNKTVNINLAGVFFHIDEDAYLKLQRYLEAIKRSFTDSQGRSEIISDIEARIAELFNERVQNDKQVIRIKDVDEVILIMGEPEDYLVDDEIFEDEPQPTYKSKSSPSRKLFRDTDNSYIGGVSSGLAHYFGIDVLWVRLAWIILIFGAGTGILLYILLWVLVPEARTTAEKIMMTGEPVTISNIEKKIKDGFENVTETVSDVAKNVSDTVSDAAKHVDFKKQGNKIKSSSKTFFDAIGDIFMFFFKIFSKFVGMLLICVGAVNLIALIISLFSVGVVNILNIPGVEYVNIFNAANSPIWLVYLLTFFAAGIPFFFLFYLGLKILINNLKSIGNVAKFTLLGVWLISIICLVIFGIREVSEHAFNATTTQKEQIHITVKDTLFLKMRSDYHYSKTNRLNGYRNSFGLAYNENDENVIYSSDIRLIVRSTKDSLASINIERSSQGNSYQSAKAHASEISYNYAFSGNELQLDKYLTTKASNKFRDQEVDIILYLPENTVLFADKNTYPFHSNSSYYNDILDHGMEQHYLKILENATECLDCPVEEEDKNYEVDVDFKDKDSSLKINNEGIEVTTDDSSLKIDKTGVKANGDDVTVNIDSDGITIKSKEE